MEYKATLVRLPEKTLRALKIKAAKDHTSLAQLIRDAVEVAYHIGVSEKGIDPKDDPFYRLVGAWKSGRSDGALNHDRDIYGRGA